MVLVVLGCSCGVCVGGGRVEITVAELIMLVITDAGRMLSFFLASTTYWPTGRNTVSTNSRILSPKPKLNGLGETPPFTLMSPKNQRQGHLQSTMIFARGLGDPSPRTNSTMIFRPGGFSGKPSAKGHHQEPAEDKRNPYGLVDAKSMPSDERVSNRWIVEVDFFLGKGKGSQVMYGRYAGRVHGGWIFTKKKTSFKKKNPLDDFLLVFSGVYSGFPASI